MDTQHNKRQTLYRALWCVRQVVLILIGLGFLAFGIMVFVSAYGLDDPFLFILTFFASNLMILISAALLIRFVYQLKYWLAYMRSGS